MADTPDRQYAELPTEDLLSTPVVHGVTVYGIMGMSDEGFDEAPGAIVEFQAAAIRSQYDRERHDETAWALEKTRLLMGEESANALIESLLAKLAPGIDLTDEQSEMMSAETGEYINELLGTRPDTDSPDDWAKHTARAIYTMLAGLARMTHMTCEHDINTPTAIGSFLRTQAFIGFALDAVAEYIEPGSSVT